MRLLLLLVTVAAAADLKLTPAWTHDTRDSTEAAKGGGRRPALEVTPVYEGGRLHISTPWGTVAALEATTGREIWRVDLKVNPKGGYGDFASRGVSLRGRRLYVGTVDGRLVCLEKLDGAHCAEFEGLDRTTGLRRGTRYVGEYDVTISKWGTVRVLRYCRAWEGSRAWGASSARPTMSTPYAPLRWRHRLSVEADAARASGGGCSPGAAATDGAKLRAAVVGGAPARDAICASS